MSPRQSRGFTIFNYKRLDSQARRVIEALAVFKRPMPPLAVDYLLEPFFPGLDVPGILRRLTRTNILTIDRSTKTVVLHPIDQDYAYSQLPEEGADEPAYTRQALERRAADYYLQLRTSPETWKSIDDLEPQLAEFEHRVRAGDYDQAARLLDLIDFDYLFLWGHYTRLAKLREKLLDQLTDIILQANNLSSLGLVYRIQGQLEQAIINYRQALVIVRKISNKQLEGIILNHLGLVYRVQGRIELAIEFHNQALDIAYKINDHSIQVTSLGNLGLAHRNLGHFKQTLEFYQQALAIDREIGDRRGEGEELVNMGVVYYLLGRVEYAIKLYQEALTIAREISYFGLEGFILNKLGSAYLRLGQIQQSSEFYREGLYITQNIGDHCEESQQLMGLGRVSQLKGEFDKANRYFQEALALNISVTNYQAMMYLGITFLYLHNPNVEETFTEAISHCWIVLNETANLYEPRYVLATALTGQAVCNPDWVERNKRPNLLTSALTEYHRALEITAAPGVVQDTLRDLELIRKAGVEGLEPIFELLQNRIKE